MTIPMYHFHTNTSVRKVENCVNKSNTRRVKRGGLSAMITDDKKICEEKKKDIKKIWQNIDSVLNIET